MFPPSFLLVQLFRRSKPRTSRTEKLKKKLDKIKQKDSFTDLREPSEHVQTEENRKKKKSKLLFPWWFKIIAYVLSLIFACVSAFFIVMKGISFGDEKSLKWLTSFVVSIFTSFLITQPIQVIFKLKFTRLTIFYKPILKVSLITMLLVFLFRKSDDMESDFKDDGKPFVETDENQLNVTFITQKAS